MALHALTRQSKIRHSASGGKLLPLRANFPIKFRRSPILANSMNKTPGAESRLLAVWIVSSLVGLLRKPRGTRSGILSRRKKSCVMCGARTKFYSSV